jgi:hypothetical protein
MNELLVHLTENCCGCDAVSAPVCDAPDVPIFGFDIGGLVQLDAR